MLVAPAEEKMWEKQPLKNGNSNITDEQINIKYEQGQQRILTEMNREKLPSFADSLKKTQLYGYQSILSKKIALG